MRAKLDVEACAAGGVPVVSMRLARRVEHQVRRGACSSVTTVRFCTRAPKYQAAESALMRVLRYLKPWRIGRLIENKLARLVRFESLAVEGAGGESSPHDSTSVTMSNRTVHGDEFGGETAHRHREQSQAPLAPSVSIVDAGKRILSFSASETNG